MTTSATLKVGRFGLDISVAAPMDYRLEGDRLSFRGYAYGASQEQAQALRQQCVGLQGNPDEPVVPVRCSWDSSLDGFYRVSRASAEVDPSDDARYRVRYSIECEQVSSFAMPRVEIVTQGVQRSGSTTVYSGNYWHARPSAWDGYTVNSTGVTTYTSEVMVGDDGAYSYYVQSAALSNSTINVTTTTSAYYAAAVSVYEGASLYRVNGRQSYNYPTSWKMSNGLIKVTPSSTTAYLFHVSGYKMGTASWTTGYDVEIGHLTGGITWTTDSCATPYTMRILRNSPEECVLRLQFQTATALAGSGALSAHQVDLALRRGERGVRTYFQATAGADTSRQWGFMFRPQTTCVSAGYNSYGIEFASNNADGVKYWMSTATACTMGVAGGRIYRSAAGSSLEAFVGMYEAYLGTELQGSGSSGWQARYYAAMGETQRVTLP